MTPALFADLLDADDKIVWSAQALRQKNATAITGMFLMFGVAWIGMSIWMLRGGLSHFPSRNSVGILAPIFAFAFGLYSLWLALSGKGLLPPPTYAVSAKQAFIAEYNTAGGFRRSCFLLDRDKPAVITGTDDRCRCRIPVVQQSRIGRSAVIFANLMGKDAEALVRALASPNRLS